MHLRCRVALLILYKLLSPAFYGKFLPETDLCPVQDCVSKNDKGGPSAETLWNSNPYSKTPVFLIGHYTFKDYAYTNLSLVTDF
jgi:hypothetical protein